MISLLIFALLQMQPMQMLREDPDRAGINTHAYEFRDMKSTSAPKGYKPVYINHYGRHGSRSDWGAPNYEYVINVLEKASAEGILAPEGDSLLAEAKTVLAVHHGADGHLTRLGEKEHRMLAERMYRNWPEVFKKGSRLVRVESSTVHRCLVSMADFTGELIRLQSDLDFEIDSDETLMKHINNDASREQRTKVRAMLAPLLEVPTDTVQVLNSLFTDPGKGKQLVGDVNRFQSAIWFVARVARASGVEANVFRHIPFDVTYKWWDYSNRALYMNHGNSVEFGKERMKAAEPLVNDIVAKADEALSTGRYAADLTFGHDFPLMSLAGFLHLSGVGATLSFDEIPEKWNDPMNIPFASNLQMVFYRNAKSGDVLVKFVYNDVERTIAGLEPVSGVYYRWDDVKAFLDTFKKSLS